MSKNLFVKSEYDVETKQAIASTQVVDRMGEVIDQSGWDLKNFKKNPILLWGHDHSEPAIGTAKGIKVVGEGKKAQLMFTPEFHDITPKAAAVKALYDAGILNSFSVGFQPIESDGNTYTKQELHEISAVNVPANPEARTLAMKSMVEAGVEKSVIAEVIGKQLEPDVQTALTNVYSTIENMEEMMSTCCDQIDQVETILETLLGIPDDDAADMPMATMSQDLQTVKERLTDVEKGLKHFNPQVDKQVTTKRLESAKVIARASDKILSKSKVTEAKVAKRAAEKLIVSLKRDLN